MNKNATFTMLVSAEQKERAMSWCKDNDTTLSREVRKLISDLAKKYDGETLVKLDGREIARFVKGEGE